MNLKKSFAFVMLIAGVSLSSCKKEETAPETPTPTPTPAFTESFSAKVDGVTFNNTIYTGQESAGAGIISIVASANGSFPSIGLSMSNTITPGTYTFDGAFGTKRGMYNVSNSANDIYAAGSGTGTLVITSHNMSTNQIVGTFSYTATPVMGSTNTDSHTISEGAFSLQY